MAEFKFSCPQCSQNIKCDTGYSGMQINCPACKQTIVVPPAAATVAPSRSIRQGTPVLAAARTPVKAKLFTNRKVLIIAAAVLLLAGLGGGGWFGYSMIKMHRQRGHLPPGLVALWSGEGDAIDSVGGNKGKLGGNVTYGSGQIGRAFVFNGAKDWVELGSPTNLHLQDFTITAWIKRADASFVTDNHNHIAMIFCFGAGGYGLVLNPNGRPGLSKVGTGGTSPREAITDTNWHHLAVTKSGGKVLFYVDATEYRAPALDLEFVFSKGAFIGGKSERNWENTFMGRIDEVAIYNRALAPSEIRGIYAVQK